jgi:hypothetical protein
MARKRSTPPRQLSHHWYLREWAEVLEKTQADAQRDLGWAKATASDLWTGKQRYTQDYVDEVAAWFHIRPYELLMPPADAIAIRQMREAVATLAITNPDKGRTGTRG